MVKSRTIRYHFIRDMVANHTFMLKKIDGSLNLADFGTKIVTTDKFVFCRDFLHVVSLNSC